VQFENPISKTEEIITSPKRGKKLHYEGDRGSPSDDGGKKESEESAGMEGKKGAGDNGENGIKERKGKTNIPA